MRSTRGSCRRRPATRDADGELDSIAVRFSETVVHAQEATPGSFTAGAFTILSAEAAAGDTVELKLQQSGSGDTGVRPAVGYTPDGAGRRARPGRQLRARRDRSRRRPTARGRCCSRRRPPTSTTTAGSTASRRAGRSRSSTPTTARRRSRSRSRQLAVTRVHAAAGQALDVDLAEPAAPDTGSAPDLTYTGGADPIRDAAGLEPAQIAYSGLHARRASPAPGLDDHGRRRPRRQARRDRHRVERAGDRRDRHRALHGRRPDARRAT